jgi:hypothetical protein
MMWNSYVGSTSSQRRDRRYECPLPIPHTYCGALWVFDELHEPNNLGWPFWFSSYYGNPRAFNDTLHGLGYKVLGYVHPYLRERMLPYPTLSPTWQRAVAEKLLVTGVDGLPHGPMFEPVRTGNLDFTNPRTVELWQEMLTHAVRDQAWDGWTPCRMALAQPFKPRRPDCAS